MSASIHNAKLRRFRLRDSLAAVGGRRSAASGQRQADIASAPALVRSSAPPLLRASILPLLLALILAAPAQAQLLPSLGGDRTGQSGFQFLKIPVDARAAAMGETVVSNATDASGLYWNPALAVQSQAHHIAFSHTRYFTEISMEYFAGVAHLQRYNLSVGASVQALNSGDMPVTTEFQSGGTGETFRFVDIAAGLTLSQALTDLFSYGVTGKLINESTAGLTTTTGLLDLGFFYRVGTTGAQVAVAIRNFGLGDASPRGELGRVVLDGDGVEVEEDFESITPPTMFLVGATYNVFPQSARNHLQVSGQLTNRNDNAESFNIGAEYVWNNTLALRTGHRFGIDEYTMPSLGVGLFIPYIGRDLRFDYGFSRRERLGPVHHFGLDLSL